MNLNLDDLERVVNLSGAHVKDHLVWPRAEIAALIVKLREAERQRDASEKQVEIRSKDSIAARIARSNVRAVEEWAATQALVARQTRYIEELERVDSVELKAKLREAEAVIAQILDYEGPEAADMRDIALTYKPTNQEESKK